MKARSATARFTLEIQLSVRDSRFCSGGFERAARTKPHAETCSGAVQKPTAKKP